MVKKGALLNLNGQVNDGHVGIVELVQNARLSKAQFLKLYVYDGDIAQGTAISIHITYAHQALTFKKSTCK